MTFDRKQHWETVYETKTPDQVSWTQDTPKTSLQLIRSFGLKKSAHIIDIGGGDSKLVDYLLDEGFEHVTVLDISANAIERAKLRLGDRAKQVRWIVSDISDFRPSSTYDVWHDRATFHFLTHPEQIQDYVQTASKAVTGYLTIGTFSQNGPQKCSGLDITQYNDAALTSVFKDSFDTMTCITEDHLTPFGSIQNFLFCSFKRQSD